MLVVVEAVVVEVVVDAQKYHGITNPPKRPSKLQQESDSDLHS